MQFDSSLASFARRWDAVATRYRISKGVASAMLVALILGLLLPTGAWAQYTESVLYNFCSTGGSDCTDGKNLQAGVIFDSKGNLYGSTNSGGAYGDGVVFELSPPASGGGPWTEKVLYSFCSIGTSCSDGAFPGGNLVFDAEGNLYGTTTNGGAYNFYGGTVFRLTPPTSGSGTWTESVLYSFCAAGGNCADGQDPGAGVIFDSRGNLYGSAFSGLVEGVVFELSPPSSGSGSWTETVLYSFCLAGYPCSDGDGPQGLVFDSNGNLYGTTYTGGDNSTSYCSSGGCGIVFELSPPSGGSGPWTETILHAFTGPPDGATPIGSLTFDANGNPYGATYGGGTHSGTPCGSCGTVFELGPPTNGSGSWTENVLYSFCSQGGSNCTDGAGPNGSLIADLRGNFYGTTQSGGTAGYGGTAFRLSPPGVDDSSWTESVLFTFCYNCVSNTGETPNAGLTLDSDKNLYGTTYGLGLGGGNVFELALPATSTVLASSMNPADTGALVTFTATVSPAGPPVPTGSVSFLYNGAAITGCSAVALSSSRVASCTTGALPLGTNTITAIYLGDDNYAVSRAELSEVITLRSTTTTVTSSLNPSQSGESVTLTATVALAGPPVPTGTVSFTALGTPISGCTNVALSSSLTAECTTTALPVGTDAIVATYSGDTNYSGSSGTFSQLVNPIPTAALFFPVTPCRVVDTRNTDGPFGGPEIAIGTSRSFTIPEGPCAGIPTTAAAYSLNVTVVPPGPLGYLTIWPTGEGQPTVSTLNSLDGRTKANAAIVPAGTGGAVSVYVNNTTNVLLDIYGYFATSSSSSLEFYPLAPCRVADTRKTPDGPLAGPALVAATQRDFPILSSSCGIPSSAQAYSLNFTVVPPASGDALDYLTVWPEGETQPVVSTLNNFTGTIVANAAIVPAGTGGVAVYASDATNLVIDVNGYFAPAGTGGGLQLYTLTPCRVLDTRKTTGAFSDELTVQVYTSACKPPITGQAYVFNATVVPTGDLGYLTLWPDEETQPVVSTLNAEDGAITSNMAIVPNKDGETDAYASGTTQFVLDISAYFAP